MRRRGFLALLGAGVSAGCIGGGGGQLEDTDGDGMVDTKDYAPWDPEVQQKSQLLDDSGSGSGGSGGSGGSTPEPQQPTPTPQTVTPEPTPNPQEFDPVVEAANLVSELGSLDDVEDNAIDSAESGSVILIGFRFRVMSHNGQIDVTNAVEIVGPGGDTVASRETATTRSVNGTGVQILVNGLQFNTQDWETGSYTANVQITDELNGRGSESVSTDFELT